tara:strand:- start:77 stop:496 length:420 start_codon:yes stop_codon:yes gene_type:complete
LRWTGLLVGLIFGVSSYVHLTSGSAAFGGFYLLAFVIALLAVFRKRVLWLAVVAIALGLVSLVLMWPEVHLNEAMFSTKNGREFMMVILVEVWMASLVLEEVRIHGNPFQAEEEPEDEDQEELPDGEGDESAATDSEQP